MNKRLSLKQALLIYGSAFLVRAFIMIISIQPYGFYKQADSNDYHQYAYGIAHGHGMYLPNGDPAFWRTPGYPLYLAYFYQKYGTASRDFDANRTAQLVALWFQIILSSFIPLLLFYLARIITDKKNIALITAWITVMHPGLVLASTYMLTEGIALIFFYSFLISIYAIVLGKNKYSHSYFLASIAAISLGIYTWLRPMGEFIGYCSTALILCGSKQSWSAACKQAIFFVSLFCLLLAPWYWRNYQLTHEWFFCPTIGPYLLCFSIPKLLRRTLAQPLIECYQLAQKAASTAVYQKISALRNTGLYVSPSVCKMVTIPIALQHPWYFLYDWTVEVIKTTFDLYSYQIVAMCNNTYWYDPLEEFLPQKIWECLYAYPLPWYLRWICILELASMCIMWIGLLAGAWLYIGKPFIRIIIAFLQRNQASSNHHTSIFTRIWLVSLILIGITIGMTGGFGYARLRLPIEPLLIILSLIFWIPYFSSKESL